MSNAPKRQSALNLLIRAGLAVDVLRGKRNAYTAAEESRLNADWRPTRMPPDDFLTWTLAQLRARARDLQRNSPVIRHFLNVLAVNVVGAKGAKLQSQVMSGEQLDKRTASTIERSWAEWSRRPTLDMRGNFSAFQRRLLKGVARDGEAFVRKWYGTTRNRFGFSLEYIDPDLLDEGYTRAPGRGENEIRMGVELDVQGAAVAYHFYDRHPASMLPGVPRVRRRIPAEEVIHLYDPERANQSRGPSWLASVMAAVNDVEKYREAELVASRVAASKMGWYERKEGGTGTLDDKKAEFETEVSPGSLGILPEGYTLTTFDPQHPSGAFGTFVKDALRGVSTGLDISYNALLSDLENVNYSSMRSGLLMDRDVWQVIQDWWEAELLWPVFEAWLSWSLLVRALPLNGFAPQPYLAATWQHRRWPWVDPLKDTQAAVLAIQHGMRSRTDSLAELGEDFDETLAKLKAEEDAASAAGVNIHGAPPPSAPSPPADEDEKDEDADKERTARVGTNGHSTESSIASSRRRF